MIEQQSIKGKEVWIRVDPYHVPRSSPNIIPTEYFTATCYTREPVSDGVNGEMVRGEDGAPRLFESPVAALSFARKTLEGTM
jgi:hypothetical protein